MKGNFLTEIKTYMAKLYNIYFVKISHVSVRSSINKVQYKKYTTFWVACRISFSKSSKMMTKVIYNHKVAV